MTFTKSTTVWCDGDGGDCPEWEQFNTPRVKDALKQARENGWVSPTWGEHYCPGCAEARGQEAEE